MIHMKTMIMGSVGLFIFALICYSCQDSASIEFRQYYAAGSLVYYSNCQNCHGDKGQGLAGLIPPLTDPAYLKASHALLACAVNYGLKGKLVIAGRTFDGEMPADALSPIEIAQVLTYVTNSFGNKMGVVTNDDVVAALGKCTAKR